ncbi:MAG: CHAT domain-containing protein [Alphaproteobacteria bacterium]|nr:CHAT domain-containing protein [Alphaproteobacteria bacterium]
MRIVLLVMVATSVLLGPPPVQAQGRRQPPQVEQPQDEQPQDEQAVPSRKRRQGQGQGQGHGRRQGQGAGQEGQEQAPSTPAQGQAGGQPDSQPSVPPKSPPTGQAGSQGRPIRVLVEQANAAFQAGRYLEAEPLYRQVLEMREQKRGDESFPVVPVMNRLGLCLAEQGKYPEAEALFRRALATAEQLSGGEHATVAMSLHNLGYALRRQGRMAEAEPILRRALAMRERVLGPEHPDVASTLVNLTQAIGITRRPAETEPMLRRALAIREKAYGPDHPSVAGVNSAIAVLLRNQGRGTDAEALMRRSIAIQEARLGPEHPRLANSLITLGMTQLTLKRYADAEASFRRAAAIRETVFGPNHPDTAQAYGTLAYTLAHQQRAEEALTEIRRATAIHIVRRENDDQRRDEGTESERRSARWLFARHVGIAYLASRGASERIPELSREAFEMQQWAQTGGVSGALTRMAARFATGSGPLAALVRERQDVQARRHALDRGLIEGATRPTAERDRAQENAMRAEIVALDRRLDALDARLAGEFPRFEELSSAQPLPMAKARELLARDEAMLVYLVRDDDAFLWIVRKDRVFWRRLAHDRKSLDEAVKGLRAWLDPTLNRALAPMPLVAAHKLYNDILPGADEALQGINRLLVVPDGPLQSLPFGVLVTSPPQGEANDAAQYAAAPWLVRKYAITVLPSVASLKALRVVAGRDATREPFVGYGDPELRGSGTGGRGAPAPRMDQGIADVAAVQGLEPLPESATELREMAKGFHATAGTVFLGRAATERAVKSANLARYRVVAFATHGLMAGEFGDNSEPALVLTPPAVGTPEDDGLLMASEVAQLKLDADWVILSACNTAAPDGTPGAEGMSGLAKAFFYAGARSLLVSHWAVASDAAVRLTTGAVAAMDRQPGIGRAEALRRSMLALLDDKAMAHPMFWAPFVLVGEGGTGR